MKGFEVASFQEGINRALLLDEGNGHWSDFIWTLWVAFIFVMFRYYCDNVLVPAFARYLSAYDREEKAPHVFDNVYIVIWSLLTEAMAIYVTLNDNGGCTPWSTDACLSGWPKHPTSKLQRWYMVLMFQFYYHELIGSLVGIGGPLKTDMLIHHVATMGLISGAYTVNVIRYGIMWQALFDTSNPLLHAAKALNTLAMERFETLKWFLFLSFALVFFVCRVAAAPACILHPALTRSWLFLPPEWCYGLIALMSVVCGIQWVWMKSIVLLAMGKDKSGAADPKKAKSE